MRQSEGNKTLNRLDAVKRRLETSRALLPSPCRRWSGCLPSRLSGGSGSIRAFPGGMLRMLSPWTGFRSPILLKTTLLTLASRPMREAS